MKSFVSVLLIALFLSPLRIICQPDYRISYHPYIFDAELAIIKSNYRLAFENYKRAFKLVETGFGRDYHNAVLCAIEIGEYAAAMDYLKRLVAKGIKKSFFENQSEYYGKLKGHGYEEFLADYDRLRVLSFEKTVNPEVQGRLGEMLNKDQEFREDYLGFHDTIQKIDAENIRNFVDIVLDYDFPTEEMLGLQSPFADNHDYHFILWHHLKNWKSDNSLVDIRPILMDAVKNGKLSPELAARYFDLSESRIGFIGNYGGTGIVQFDEHTSYILDYEAFERESVDKNRRKLGLYDLADFEKRLRYHFLAQGGNSKFEVLKLGSIDRYPGEAREVIRVKELR